MTKKTLLLSILLGTFLLAPHVFAQGFVPLAPIPNLTDQPTIGNGTNTNVLANFFNNLYKYLIGLAAAIAVIEIIWGGLEISTQDSVSKQGQGRERIQEAILGLVLVLSPVLVFSIINPSILNLSLNLGPIKGSPPAAYNPSGGGPQSKVDTTKLANGVTQKVTGTYLQRATFSSPDPTKNNDAAKAWASSCSQGAGIVEIPGSSCLSSTSGSSACNQASDAVSLCEKASQFFYFFDTSGFFGGKQLVSANPTAALSKSYLDFLSTCTTDGGAVCVIGGSIHAVEGCADGVTLVGGSNKTCYQASLFCHTVNGAQTFGTAVYACSATASIVGT